MTDSHTQATCAELPGMLGKAAFISRFAGIYEHSSWVAERTWLKGIDASHTQVSELAAAMASVLADASHDEQLRLIRAHFDLAGKAALKGELTNDSTDEQASAGLGQCTADELSRFQQSGFVLRAAGRIGRKSLLFEFNRSSALGREEPFNVQSDEGQRQTLIGRGRVKTRSSKSDRYIIN